MSETRFPPSGPSGIGHGGAGAEKPLLQNALVTQAPAPVMQGVAEKTLLLEGRVTAHNHSRGETTFSTAKGDIVIQTGGSLPLGTDVHIDMRMQNLSLRASITVLRQKSAEMKAAQEIAKPAQTPPAPEAPPPVPVKEGDRILALRLPQDPPPAPPASTPPPATSAPAPSTTTPAPAPVTLEQAAQIIEAARAALGVARLPAALPALPPVPLPVLWQVLNTRDVMTALIKLPEAMQAQILEFIARPDVAAALRQALPPAQAQTLLPPAHPADTEAMTQAQMAIRPRAPAPAPSSATTPAAAPPPMVAGGMLGGLLPMIEGMLQQGIAPLNLMAGKLPQMTPAAGQLPLPQNMFTLTVQQIIPPPLAAAPAPLTAEGEGEPPATARPMGSLVATVESLTPDGMPVLRTADAHFVMRQSSPLPVGTRIIFTLAPATADDMLGPIMATPHAAFKFDPLFSRGWPALDEALQLLSGMPAAQALMQTIPAPAARLTPTTLFFLAALRMGNIESWLGETTLQAIRNGGRKDIAERLAQDFGRIAAQSKTMIAGEWRAISMPLMQQDQHISMIQFFIRAQQQGEDAESDSPDAASRKMTRFILNLQLSRMGDMQLDGLLHKKRFDLILRAEEKLPADIRQEIAKRFTAGLEQTGMEGGISFQTRQEGWVSISSGGETVMA